MKKKSVIVFTHLKCNNYNTFFYFDGLPYRSRLVYTLNFVEANLMNSVCREFSASEIEDEIREAFRVFDKEGNGFITIQGKTHCVVGRGDAIIS